MLRRPHYIALGAVLLLALIFFSLPSQSAAQLKLVLSGFFLPLFGLVGSAHDLAEEAGNTLVPRRVLLRQLADLRRENQQLIIQLAQSTQLWQENDRLRQALAWQQKSPSQLKLKLARVVLREPTTWWRTLHIDRGQRDGVATDMAVLTTNGLVGRISQVGFSRSQVVLIGDPSLRIAAFVEETPGKGADGIIEASPSSLQDPSVVDLTFIDRQNTIQPGLEVVTSGVGGVIPKGIAIGRVIDSRSVESGLYTEARVKLAADLAHLEEVWVMFP